MKIPKETVKEILDRVNIVELIGEYISLNKNGKKYQALCPFHNEKTPSFTVFAESGRYQCFGCGEKGDAITFLMKKENLSYPVAVKRLAECVGVAIQSDKIDEEQKKRNRGFLLNRKAAEFFCKNLFSPSGSNALAYLQNERKLSVETIKTLGLGYAPDSFDNLKRYLLKCGFSERELVEYSLCNQSKNGHTYDAFRNRVMFPIQDAYGKVVAFGGRVLGDGVPKYLNSAETPVFHKGQHLFGLHRAKEYGKEQLILCEGYMDVISLNSVGIMNAVATLGTALTVEQAELLKKQTKRVLLNFDGDNAGQTATERALTIFEKIGLAAKVVSLDHAKDPDEYIKCFGKDAYIQALSKAPHGFEFRMNRILSKYDLSQIDDKIQAAKDLVALIAKTDSVATRNIYAKKAAERLEISTEAILQEAFKLRYLETEEEEMKITIYSRNDMEKLLSQGKIDNTAIISFHDPVGRGRRCLEDYQPIDFTGKCDCVMQIALHDLDPEALADFDLTVDTYFPEADELAEFIYKAKEDGLDIICQCEYGQSRSAGCAAAILQHFESRGIDIFTDYRYYPNQLVYHKVFDALTKYMVSHKGEKK